MALTRKMLKELGIEEESIEKIIAAHSETVEALKKYKVDSEKMASLEEELRSAREELAKDYKSKYDELELEFSGYRNEVESSRLAAKKKEALRKLLRECGVLESCVDAVVRVTDLDSISLDETGEIADRDKTASDISQNWAAFIPKTKTVGANIPNPPAMVSERVYTIDDIKRMTPWEINANYAAIKKSLNRN